MSNLIAEPTTIGLGEKSHNWLQRFKEEGIFAEMRDAYRFAVAFYLSKQVTPPEIVGKKNTIFNIGTIDPDKELYLAISCLMPNIEGSIYQMAERLADAGIAEMAVEFERGTLDVVALIENQIGN
jgi:hypothetical protein